VKGFDVVVVGGGLVGAALAYGMRKAGLRIAVVDEGDRALRASRGNFGLIWVQGKGRGLAPYGNFTQRSAREWPQFAAALARDTGVDVALRQPGGFHLCLTERELELRAASMAAMQAQAGFERYEVEVLRGAELSRRLPGVGRGVVGGTYCALDGDCNPLRLLRALHVALERAQCAYLPDARIDTIEARAGRFVLHARGFALEAGRVVLAAGLGSARLAPMVGLYAPLRPNKGQIMALARVPAFLRYPVETVRQTDDGTVLVGDSQEDAGFDETPDPAVLGAMARRALAAFPSLAAARVVRAWAALRVMSPDGFPVYGASRTHPGAFLVSCHSGVTLAAAHARIVGPALACGGLPDALRAFAPERFDVRTAA
jgi:glycine/D-amino acid oxidase-like deaminating enzyme